MTWNIELGLDVEAAADVLATDRRLRGADVMLLQEMDEAGTAFIAEALGCRYEFAASCVHSKTGRSFGNAIVTPWTTSGAGVVDLPHRARIAGEARNALTADVDVDGIAVTVWSTHTETPLLSRSKRSEQIDRLGVRAASSGHERIVIGGDFNTASKRSVDDLVGRFSERGFAHTSAGAGPTLRRARRDFTLDHVFSKGLTRVAAGVAGGVVVSDHDPVWVELELG